MKMKKLYFIPAAMLGLAVAGCSSDDIVVGENQGPQWNSEGKGYVALSLNLPTQASTGMRQSSSINDQFDDGEPDEYAVKNATLLLFKGASETAATLQASYTLPVAGSEIQDPENDQVTSTVQLTQQINQIDAGTDKLYALVVLNKNNVFNVDEYQQLYFSDTPDYRYGATGIKSLTLENLMTKVVNNTDDGVDAADDYTREGILMMNAPLASAVGAENYSGTVSTLVDVTTGIHPTEREAQENPAASVYVERAVAKVSVTATNASGTLDDAPSTVKEKEQTGVAAWAIQGWMLNNTNTQSYFAHNYPLTNCPWWSYVHERVSSPSPGNYRFIGAQPVGNNAAGTNAGYRIYWGQDPNYNEKAGEGLAPALCKINSTYFTTNNMHGLGLDKYDYCFENTFTTAFQNQDQTTQAVIAVQFNGGNDFWTVNGSTSTVYINQKDIDNMVKKAFVNTQAVYDVIEEGLADGKTFDPATDLVVEYDKDAAGVEGNNALNNQAGKWTVKAVRLTASGVSKFDSYLVVDKIVPDDQQFNQEPNRVDNSAYDAGLAAAQDLQIECYDNGLAYYPVNIRHFGQDLTPWDADDAEGNVSYPNTDGKAEANWLGRYGVLRNNWYQLDVTNVTNIGYSDVPEITDPDDPVARYISVRINILSWALRKQSVEL